MLQNQKGMLVVVCVAASLVLTEGFPTGILCQLINDAGGIVQTFNQYDCSSCWYHCIMSPTCVKIYYTYDGACDDKDSQVEKVLVQSEEDFRAPSETCLQLDASFANPLVHGCSFKMASMHRMLTPAHVHQECTLFDSHTPYGHNEFVQDISCADCQAKCKTLAAATNSDTSSGCDYFWYFNQNLCYTVVENAADADTSQCAAADAQYYIPRTKPCGGGAYGDPHFKGFGNQPFEFHGFPGGIFNIYSDPAHQVNVLLASIGDPDRTYMSAVGIVYGSNEVQVLVSAQHCFDPQACRLQVQLGNKSVLASEGQGRVTAVEGGVKLQVADVSRGAQHVHVFTPALAINVTKGIGGLHLDVGLTAFPGVIPSERVHGVVGQTMSWPAYPSARVVGDELDYVTSHLFASDSVFDTYAAVNADVWHEQH